MTQINETMNKFTAQQLQAANEQTTTAAAYAKQQVKIFEMLEALQDRSISGEPNDKNRKVVDKSWLSTQPSHSNNTTPIKSTNDISQTWCMLITPAKPTAQVGVIQTTMQT